MVDDRFTILPLPCACITRISCFMLSSTPSTFGIEGGRVALRCLLRHWTGLTFGAGVVDGHIEPAKAGHGLVDQVAADFVFEVCCGLQKLVRAMMLQGCRKADRAEVVERDPFATPNSLKSHGERNLLSPLSNTCAITPKLCMPSRPIHPPKNYPALKSTYRG